jgi:hypothetical protein
MTVVRDALRNAIHSGCVGCTEPHGGFNLSFPPALTESCAAPGQLKPGVPDDEQDKRAEENTDSDEVLKWSVHDDYFPSWSPKV